MALGKKVRPKTGDETAKASVAADGGGKIGMGNFDYMNIDELK